MQLTINHHLQDRMSENAIIHQLQINASSKEVFEGISLPSGLNQWWTKGSSGRPELGSLYDLDFGNVQWQAQVTHMIPPQEFELTMTRSDPDWLDTIINFQLTDNPQGVSLKFTHRGWPSANDHFHISNYCWAMYLRILKRFLEHGEKVAYENRLNV